MDKPENCCNCWFDYILTLQRGTSKTYCALELSKQMSRLIDIDTDEMRYVFCSYCRKWTWVYPETVMHCPHCGRDVTRRIENVNEVSKC